MEKYEIEKLFYIDKNYSGLKEILKNTSDSWSFNILGKIYLKELNLEKAEDYFKKTDSKYEYGYCLFLKGEIKEALNILINTREDSPAIKWLIFLIKLINNQKNNHTTYFQVRNFYEQDLEMLFELKQYKIIEKIISEIKYISQYNREIYKYSARVLYNNGYYKEAEKLIEKSIEICYKDPENHFISGEIYLKEEKINQAKQEFTKAIEVNNGYIPAQEKLNLCN